MTDISDADLRVVARLAHEQRDLELKVEIAERELALAREALRNVAEHELPDAMHDVGLRTYETTDGLKVQVQDKFRCGQLDDGADKEEGRPLSERLEALAWLDENGHGDIARRVVAVTLGAGSQEDAVNLIRLIRSSPGGNKMTVDHRRLVPWSTLSSFARGQVRDQYDPPLDLLGVQRVTVSKITRKDD